MKDYTKFMKWAVFSMIDRSTQDDHKSKIQIVGLFASPVVAEDSFIPNLPNKETKRYLLHVDDLERFEAFYNFIQDLNERYGDRAVYHIKDGNFSTNEKTGSDMFWVSGRTQKSHKPKRSEMTVSRGIAARL